MLLKNAKILIVDDDADVLIALKLMLKPLANTVVTEENPNQLTSLLQREKFDLVILDMNFDSHVNTGNEGIFWLNKINGQPAPPDVILITAYADIDLAVRSLKQGACDFIVKPWKNEKLIDAIKNCLEKKKTVTMPSAGLQADGQQIVGESEAMQAVFTKIAKIAPTDANVLILGENGTGKDLLAKAIHQQSARKNKPFVKVDVGALTESLFESELFGYKKGAFTDARTDREGRFESANGGTLFLDEIGNISLRQQARLLTVLQNRVVTPLGSNSPIPIDIRLICATNVGLANLADENKFRKDLIYRINTVEMNVPPLRDRDDDLLLLAKYFTTTYAEKYGKEPFSLTKAFEEKLMKHPFPGNVRELQYALERAVIMADDTILDAENLIFSPIENSALENTAKSGTNAITNLDALEKTTILNVIEKNKGNISKSAKELGITRTALYRRLDKYDI
ncbi:MAG: sigma-54 dependent transcriptional regulator [Leeuwenhoekiella sp.]